MPEHEFFYDIWTQISRSESRQLSNGSKDRYLRKRRQKRVHNGPENRYSKNEGGIKRNFKKINTINGFSDR